MGPASAPALAGPLAACLLLFPDFTLARLSPQMQVLLAEVQNSEQLLRTLQGTVSQAQERVQLQMVRARGLEQEGEERVMGIG